MSFIQVPEGYCNPECYLSSVGFLSSFEPCLEITEQDCLQLMCDNINKKYGIEIDCNKMLLIANFSSGLFSSRTLTFNE